MSPTNRERYLAACHAMQSGVAFMANHNANDLSPKHLRVGINTAHVDINSIIQLLIKKGILDQNELDIALCEGMEAEVKLYEEEIKGLSFLNVKLA